MRVSRQGSRFFGSVLALDFRFGSMTPPRLGISASKRYGNAVARNRFKRCLREAFRGLQHSMPENLELHVSPKGPSPAITPEACVCDLKKFLGSIKKQPLPNKDRDTALLP